MFPNAKSVGFRCQSLETRVAALESELQDSANNLTNVKDDLIDCKAEKKGLEEDTAVINQVHLGQIFMFP